MVWNEILKRDIPAGWNCFEMQNLCNISRGASPRPIEAYMDTTNTGIPWIKISDATEDIESPYLLKIKDCIIPEGKEKINLKKIFWQNSLIIRKDFINFSLF